MRVRRPMNECHVRISGAKENAKAQLESWWLEGEFTFVILVCYTVLYFYENKRSK